MKSVAGPAGGPAPLRALAGVWLAYFIGIGLFNPFAPLWFKELGFSRLAIGTLASLQSWTRIGAPYAWGWLGDHSGHRVRLMRTAAGLSLLAAAALLWVRGYTGVALCTVLLYLANGGVVPLSEATLAHHLRTDTGMDSARYGRVRMWGSVGFIGAVLLGGVLLQQLGIAALPALLALSYGALLAATLRVPDTPDDVSTQGQAMSVSRLLRRPEVAWFFASIFFTVLAHTGVYAFFSLYLDGLGYSKSAVGVLWAVAALAEIGFFWFQGPLLSRLAPERWLQLAALGTALRFATVGGLGAWWPALVFAQVLHALTFGAHHAACILMITRHFPGPLRGRGQALYSMLGYGLSGVIGGLAGGWISGRVGFAAVFWAAAACALLGLGCATLARRSSRGDAAPA